MLLTLAGMSYHFGSLGFTLCFRHSSLRYNTGRSKKTPPAGINYYIMECKKPFPLGSKIVERFPLQSTPPSGHCLVQW